MAKHCEANARYLWLSQASFQVATSSICDLAKQALRICVPKRYHPGNQKQGWYMYACARIKKETVAQL